MKYFSILEKSDPLDLTENVWHDVSFLLTSKRNTALLRVVDLEIRTDEIGDEYIVLSASYATKNFQDGLSDCNHVSMGRIPKLTQVEVVKCFLRKLHQKSDRFFQMAKTHTIPPDETSYTGLPLGKNTNSCSDEPDFRESWFMKGIQFTVCVQRLL